MTMLVTLALLVCNNTRIRLEVLRVRSLSKRLSLSLVGISTFKGLLHGEALRPELGAAFGRKF